ncbi:hypothetical protein NBM05_07385 [Rothia sp. AR01]|uniref:Uncharacterized protein n=1 Tax=Rothia santali TaxID=2949643 RepID=A0A9X2HK96_9MICC|nr:hypothetical protein [Rothia santali]MCP3425833.1 hypothetical protein [Rothia santali]
MRRNYEANPGSDPQQVQDSVEEALAAEAREWEQDPDRWMRIGEDPVDEAPLEETMETLYPGATQMDLVRLAALTQRQELLLQRAWMVDLADRPSMTPRPAVETTPRLQAYLQGLIEKVQTL